MEEEAGEDAGERVLTAGHYRTWLEDWKTLQELVTAIVAGRGGAGVEAVVFKKAQAIIEKYQEEGQLLEPHLEAILPELMRLVPVQEQELALVRRLCSIVHALMTVCGHKTVVKFFPHQVADLELAVALLQRSVAEAGREDAEAGNIRSSLKEDSTGSWETHCTLLLWLSILVLIPFDMASMDTALAQEGEQSKGDIPPLVRTMVSMCQEHFLTSPGPMRQLAGLLLARLLTRPDMAIALSSFADWCSHALADHANVFLLTGVTSTLVAIFKFGGRDVLLPLAAPTWEQARSLAISQPAKQSALLRKLLVKLIQRIGLTYLEPRVPSWRYLRGHRSMPSSFNSDPASGGDEGSLEEGDQEEETFIHVPEEVEEVMEQLLAGLRDKDTVVRWSAAKGIGRVTSRLTSQLADDVVASVLELFRPIEGDGAWHGGCLALAELARRGLLLPQRLPTVVPVIVRALHYDVRRGPHSVGSHVRDAAAYVCWAFARAYSSQCMRDHLLSIAPALLSIACYDREVNCRRAAASAFQECVGRQGNFPNGIDLVNAADFFALGSRANSYRNVALFVAQFHEYRVPLIDELLYTKIQHWDKSLRELASVSLALLVRFDPPYFAGPVLDALLSWILSPDLTLRHGATLTTAEVISALHGQQFPLSAARQVSVAEIVLAIEKARLYRGKGGEIMRGAVCRLIECASVARLPLSPKVQKTYHDTIDDNLKHPNSQIQVSAVAALKSFTQSYFLPVKADSTTVSTSKYLAILKKDPNQAAKRGSALAFIALPHQLLLPVWRDVLSTLCSAVLDRGHDGDAETRVNAVRGLCVVCETLFAAAVDADLFVTEESAFTSVALTQVIKTQVMDALLDALDDYAIDNRGDVGSWVREAAMEALERCSYLLCKQQVLDQPEPFDSILATKVVGGLAKQAVEKIDKVRDAAGKTLQRLLHSEKICIAAVPHGAELVHVVAKDPRFNWASPGDSLPRLVQFLRFPEYRHHVLCGLVISLGGLAESLARASLQALLQLLQSGTDYSLTTVSDNGVSKKDRIRSSASKDGYNKVHIHWLGTGILQVLKSCAGNDRVIIPTFKTLDILFSKRVLTDLKDDEQNETLAALLDSTMKEIHGTKDVAKLLLAINILTHLTMMHHASVSTNALLELLSLLSHRYPKVRKVCAEQVYLLFLQLGDQFGDTEFIDLALEVVSETCWEGPLEDGVKDERDKLLHLFKQQQRPTTGLTVPK